jgi:hypothetical protein
MRTIKTICKVILMIIACVSLILACCETTDGTINLGWNLGWMAAFAISAKILDMMGTFDKEEA